MIDRFKTQISKIFDDEQKLAYQLLVEKEIAFAQYKINNISEEAWNDIETHCNPKFIKLNRVKEIESNTHHDLMAVVLAITEQCNIGGKFIHLGATSMDIQDTVLGLQLKEAKKTLSNSLTNVIRELKRLTEEHRNVVCIGRTHGQHALPMTMGYKFANFLNEFVLSENQLIHSKVAYGKISGAIGTYASYNTDSIEKIVLEKLGLESVVVTTQIIPRVLFMPFLSSLLSISSSAERLAKEIRNLQRPEIGELFEGFDEEKQIGSSTMPQKRNPHRSERICGLARVIRNLFTVQVENIAVEHERDLTNSAPERITFLDIISLVDFILIELKEILLRLKIDLGNINKNLQLSGGRNMAEAIMIRLAPIIGRQEAHELLNRISSEKDFIDSVKTNDTIKEHLSESEIKDLLIPENYLGLIQERIDLILKS